MILTLQGDGVLRAYASVEAVTEEIEGLDAAEVLRAVFDEGARPYRIEWIRPNRYGRRWLGFLRSMANGVYTLVPSGPPDVERALDAIRSASAIEEEALATVRGIERSSAESEHARNGT